MPPHPATVVQPKAPHPAAVVQEEALPPHPATVVQPKRPFGAMEAPPPRAPHAATVAQPKRPFGVLPVPPSRAATMKANGFARLVQRAQALPNENLGKAEKADIELIGKKEWVKKVPKKSSVTIRAFVYLVSPGIAVETDDEADTSFPRFIAETLGQIRLVNVGKKLVAAFDPKNGFARAAEDPYKGITLLITEMKHRGTLWTTSFYTRSVDGAWRGGKDKATYVPRIVFPNKPSQDTRLDIGADKNPAQVTSEGVIGHLDFPNQTCPFDLILFHELCHAYYFQIGMAPEYFALPGNGQYADYSNTIEEMLVCGLELGRGLEICENNYRVQKGLALRKTYKAVGLADGVVKPEAWSQGNYIDPADLWAQVKPTGLQNPRAQNIDFWKKYQKE